MLALPLLALLVQHVLAHSARPSASPSAGVLKKRLIVFGDSLSDDGSE